MAIKSIDVFKSVIADTVLLAFTRDVTIDGITDEVHEYARMTEGNARELSEALRRAARKNPAHADDGSGQSPHLGSGGDNE